MRLAADIGGTFTDIATFDRLLVTWRNHIRDLPQEQDAAAE